MRLIIKSGEDQVLNATAEDGYIIINLHARWPEAVAFNKKTNEFMIQATRESPMIRIRAAARIEVDAIETEKEQIIARYRRLDLVPAAEELSL